MLVQKRKEQLKAYEKQEKMLREMKQSGKSTKQAVCIIKYSLQINQVSFRFTHSGYSVKFCDDLASIICHIWISILYIDQPNI